MPFWAHSSGRYSAKCAKIGIIGVLMPVSTSFPSFFFIKVTIVHFYFQGLIIALTSDFIPRMVYQYKHSNDTNLVGYVNFSLAGKKKSYYQYSINGKKLKFAYFSF